MKNKIIIFFIVFFSFFSLGFDYSKAVSVDISFTNTNSSGNLKNKMIKNIDDKKVVSDTSVTGAIRWTRNILLGLVFIITVGALVYTGIRLATSRGNPEEFKKTWLHLIYIILGLFIVFASWGIVNIVTKINIF